MTYKQHCARRLIRAIALAWAMLVPCLPAAAEGSDSNIVYSDEHPLVYEDAWDLWPYAFLNENGEPVGYNIDLLKLIFKELDIPYIIRLKPTQDALNDLKSGHSHLMLGMDAHFHNDYASYGQSVIQIFTHSVLHQKSEPNVIKTVNDLANHKVIVHQGSFSHHLMEERGWGTNAIPYNDMQDAVQLVHTHANMQIVWNTLSLKWLIFKLHYEDELELTPVNIQHGEYKFMSNDHHLLHQLDSIYTQLNANGQLQDIQNKWFYPERQESGIPSWIWKVVAITLLLTLLYLIYYIFYRRYERKMTKNVSRTNHTFSLILKTSQVRMWLYDIASRTITKYNDDGHLAAEGISPSIFFHDVVPEDFELIRQALQQAEQQKEEKQTVEVHAKDARRGTERWLVIHLSVLRTDKNGKPAVIIGSTNDVTDERLRQQQVKDTMLRYQAIFETALVDTVAYDEHGIITNMNQKATNAFADGISDIVKAKITLKDVLGLDNVTVDNIEYTYLTQIYHGPDDRALNRYLKRDELLYELQLVPVRNDDGQLLAVYGTGRDVTEVARSYNQIKRQMQQQQLANDELSNYIRSIDFVLKNGGVRMVTYSPDTHTLTIYSEIGHAQYQLTQTRALGLTADDAKKQAQRVFNSMDNRTQTSIQTNIKTLIRVKDHIQLHLYWSFIPTIGADGQVTEYFGLCRDISEIKATEENLARETAKAQEVETIKNAFLRNMSYEIRTPLTSVVGFAELFEQEHTADDEEFFINEIKDNSSRLLNLINDILFLSRLDAQMIEFKKAPVDIAKTFEGRCQQAWAEGQQPGVSYIVDCPYHHLVVDVDEQNLGIVINQILANAVQYTTEGQVRARFDYTGEDLVLAFMDTGCGISAEQQEHIFERFNSTSSNGTGLGLSICYEIIRQMGGKIRIKSDVGKGTIIWVTVPCHCTELVRK